MCKAGTIVCIEKLLGGKVMLNNDAANHFIVGSNQLQKGVALSSKNGFKLVG